MTGARRSRRANPTPNPTTRLRAARVSRPLPPGAASRLYRLYRFYEAEERAAADERRRAGGRAGQLPGAAGRVRDHIASLDGRIRGRTLAKIVEVFEAAAADPAAFGSLAAEMDRTGTVDGPYTKLRRLRDEARIRALAPVAGRFRTLVLDPPWDTDGLSDSCGPHYARMPVAAIAALPVPAWADAESHLYLWATNNALAVALPLLAGWGFSYKTVHTWTKPNLGRGQYFRNTTEQVLFAVRGGIGTRPRAMAVRTHHAWPVGGHSEKPEGFYDLVRACSYPPYGEGFQRQARPDFTDLFTDAGREAAE
ncbi:hypothetical protein GMJLKIPL_5552 [Methylobacterium isbiliense]|uniref:Uncharacterized protein n=1 Tax=Methylobacterium isbiliense TaxID=315478 RepID=A0ABQ4SM58_9HYPH|nr:hypothetical protein GMJLKIPL_5552 [Methylobacterium isbiliense]